MTTPTAVRFNETAIASPGRNAQVVIGLDVGSMTVKAVVMDPTTNDILWKDYERHETRQPEKVFAFLNRIGETFPIESEATRIFITGSGGGILAKTLGA